MGSSHGSPATLLARSTTRFRVVVKHQAKDQDDQPEQRAQHDDGAHVPTPSKPSPNLLDSVYYLNSGRRALAGRVNDRVTATIDQQASGGRGIGPGDAPAPRRAAATPARRRSRPLRPPGLSQHHHPR